MRINPSAELSAELTEEIAVAYLIHSDNFRPSRENGDGFISQGYEAYQMIMGLRATRTIRLHLAHRTDLSLDFLQDHSNFEPTFEEPVPVPLGLENQFKAAIQSALGVDPLAWDLVRQMAYGGESMRNFSIRTGRVVRNVSRSVSSKIKRSLQASLGHAYLGKPGRRGNLRRIATAIGTLFSKEEFEALAPVGPAPKSDQHLPVLPVQSNTKSSRRRTMNGGVDNRVA